MFDIILVNKNMLNINLIVVQLINP